MTPEIAPAFAVTIAAVLLVSFPIVSVASLIRQHPGTAVTVGCILAQLGLILIQLAHLIWHNELRTVRWGVLTLAAQAVLIYLPFVWARDGWVGTPYFLAASALLLLPRSIGWPVFGFVVVSMPVIECLLGGDYYYNALYYFVSVLGLGLAVYGLTRLADLVKELHETRSDLAGLAVAQERLRFARDLHDLLGYSLSAITLKSELVYRLADRQTARAKQELEGVLDLARQALADVRAVSSSYREMSLNAECASAVSILSAADIKVTVDMGTEDLGPTANTVLATVLREGVTNLLRHSKAQHCEIHGTVTDESAQLCITNDGVRIQAEKQARSREGTGIQNLIQRVELLGGRLEAGVRDDGWFRLAARVPLFVQDDSAFIVSEDGAQDADTAAGPGSEDDAPVAVTEDAADHNAA